MHALSRERQCYGRLPHIVFHNAIYQFGRRLAAATSPFDVIDAVDGFVWGPIMILLLLGTHIFMTIRTGFIQRKLGTGIKLSLRATSPTPMATSPSSARSPRLAATIGGWATSSAWGLRAFCLAAGRHFLDVDHRHPGIATKYSEVFIGVKYRVKDHSGKMLGGAIRARARLQEQEARPCAVLFALFASLAAFGIGASTQSNSLADALYNTSLIDGAAIPQWLVGIVVVALVAIVILGGIKSISRVREKLVPVMAIFTWRAASSSLA